MQMYDLKCGGLEEPAHIRICYQSAALLVEIPCWGDILRTAPADVCGESPPPPKRSRLEDRLLGKVASLLLLM